MQFNYRDILKAPLNKEELEKLAALGGFSVVDLVNKRSQALKKMDVNMDGLSQEEGAKLLMENPRVMHRPLFSDGKKLVVGFKQKDLGQLEELVG